MGCGASTAAAAVVQAPLGPADLAVLRGAAGDRPRAPGALKSPQRRLSMVFLYGRAGRLTAKHGGFWPRRAVDLPALRRAAFERGLAPGLRAEAWPVLLGVLPAGCVSFPPALPGSRLIPHRTPYGAAARFVSRREFCR
jgi:hypothetical protein